MIATAEDRMAKKKAKRGRPKGDGRIETRLAIVAKPEWLAWLDELRFSVPTTTGLPLDRSGAIDYALRFLAEKTKRPMPPPRL